MEKALFYLALTLSYFYMKEGVIMPEEKKSRYTEAQNRATQKYIKDNLEEIRFRVKKGEKDRYKIAAEKTGLSLAKFFLTAADEKIVRDSEKNKGDKG